MEHLANFYSESDVRRACSTLLKDLPQAEESGFFENGGQNYGTIGKWAHLFQISLAPLRRNISKLKIQPVKGKSHSGIHYNFYSESDVRSACVDQLEKLFQADKSGFFEKEGQRYGTISAWSRFFSLSTDAIQSRLKKREIPTITGKNNLSRKFDFYSEPDIRSACADLLEDIHQADESGFFEKNGRRYGTIETWGRQLTISASAIKRHLKKFNCTSINGRTKGGKITKFYSEPNVRSACANLLLARQSASEGGEKRNPKAA